MADASDPTETPKETEGLLEVVLTRRGLRKVQRNYGVLGLSVFGLGLVSDFIQVFGPWSTTITIISGVPFLALIAVAVMRPEMRERLAIPVASCCALFIVGAATLLGQKAFAAEDRGLIATYVPGVAELQDIIARLGRIEGQLDEVNAQLEEISARLYTCPPSLDANVCGLLQLRLAGQLNDEGAVQLEAYLTEQLTRLSRDESLIAGELQTARANAITIVTRSASETEAQVTALLAAGEIDEAISLLRQSAEEQEPETAAGWIQLGALISDIRPQEAIRALEQGLFLEPDNFDIRLNLLELYRMIGDQPSATQMASSLIGVATTPDQRARAYYQTGLTMITDADAEGAEDNLQAALALNQQLQSLEPGFDRVHQTALTHIALSRIDHALHSNFNDSAVHFNDALRTYLFGRETEDDPRYDSGLIELREALAEAQLLNSSYASAANSFDRVFARLSGLEESTQSINIQHRMAEARTDAGYAALETGQLDRALERLSEGERLSRDLLQRAADDRSRIGLARTLRLQVQAVLASEASGEVQAADKLDEGLSLLQSVQARLPGFDARTELARMHMLYADISLLAADEDQALDSLYAALDALDLGRDFLPPAERAAAISVFDQIRSVHVQASDLTSALSATAEATRLIEGWLETEWSANTQFQLAEHFVHQGELKVQLGRTAEAVADLQNAIRLVNDLFDREVDFNIDVSWLLNIRRQTRALQSQVDASFQD